MDVERPPADPSGGEGAGPAPADDHADDLAALHRVSTLAPGDPEDRLRQWLDAGCAALGASAGLVLRGDGDRTTVRAVAGEGGRGRAGPAIGDVVEDPRVLEAIGRRATVAVLGGSGERAAAAAALGRGAVVASPLWVSGEVAGALAFVADVDHPPFSAWALALVDVVADGVARVLEHQADNRQLAHARSQAEAMIDLVPDPMVRLDRAGCLLDGRGAARGTPFDPCGAVRAGGEADAETHGRVRTAIARALDSGSLHSAVFATDPGVAARRVEARFVPAGDDEVLCIVRDITDRHRAERALAEQVAFEALVTSISTRLISCSPAALDEAIEEGLGAIAGFFAADTAAIDELSADGATLHRSHRWTRAGHEGGRRRGQRVGRAGLGPLAARFERTGHVFAPGPHQLPPELVRSDLVDPDDVGVLWVRLGAGNDVAGVLGLTWRSHEPPATDEVLGLVRFAADAFHGAIRRRSAAVLAQGQAAVFEAIARDEPVVSTVLAARDLLARHSVGATVVICTVAEHRLHLVTDEPDHPWAAWFAALPTGLGNPYGQAVATGEPVVVADARTDPRFGGDAVPDDEHRSVSVHPVRSSRDGRTLAVVALLAEEPSGAVTRPTVLASVLSLVTVALEREADVRQLAHQATHDPLTGVGNRAALLDRLTVVLARARRTGRPVAVLFCDLDGFKAVNDRHGHDVGDRLLVEVADRIRRAVRPSDTVSRTGGDEFVVVCEDLGSPGQADLIAERIREAIEAVPLRAGDQALDVRLSIGVALADPVLDDPDRVLRTADLAMYEVKERNRTGPVRPARAAEPEAEAHRRADVPADLAAAIAGDDLDLHHQPLVGRDGTVVGIEVLLRGTGEHRGLGAERLVAAAADLGLAGHVGRWVRRRALADWSDEGSPGAGGRPPVHVNVSGAELLGRRFVEQVVADLGQASAAPTDLVLEVREADLVDPAARTVVADLGRVGVPVLVDAVGEGGLPLAELVTLPIRGIKLGPALVGRLGIDTAGLEAVRSLVLLAHGLGWRSLAVGVESEHQRAVLFGFGVDAVQGRAVAMPAPHGDVVGWLDRRQHHEP